MKYVALVFILATSGAVAAPYEIPESEINPGFCWDVRDPCLIYR